MNSGSEGRKLKLEIRATIDNEILLYILYLQLYNGLKCILNYSKGLIKAVFYPSVNFVFFIQTLLELHRVIISIKNCNLIKIQEGREQI